jgi:hypothetical protein
LQIISRRTDLCANHETKDRTVKQLIRSQCLCMHSRAQIRFSSKFHLKEVQEKLRVTLQVQHEYRSINIEPY